MLNEARKTYGKHYAVGALVAALGAGSYVIAAVSFGDFTSGSTISAAEMNVKLKALQEAVNAAEASVTCPANTPTRFTDKGNGTVCDSQTGLMWEIKTGAPGTGVPCLDYLDCPDPHSVNNQYTWAPGSSSTVMTGALWRAFLPQLNDLISPTDGTVTSSCFGGHCDWRVPTIGELRSIRSPAPDCTAPPCIAAGFPGPTQERNYHSSTSFAFNTTYVWVMNFENGGINWAPRNEFGFARAVRGGR